VSAKDLLYQVRLAVSEIDDTFGPCTPFPCCSLLLVQYTTTTSFALDVVSDTLVVVPSAVLYAMFEPSSARGSTEKFGERVNVRTRVALLYFAASPDQSKHIVPKHCLVQGAMVREEFNCEAWGKSSQVSTGKCARFSSCTASVKVDRPENEPFRMISLSYGFVVFLTMIDCEKAELTNAWE